MPEGQNEKKTWTPEPADSFENEFANTMLREATRAMGVLGFNFRGSKTEEGQTIYRGERSNNDGTIIEIVIKKGGNYKSPKELSENK